MKIHSAKLNLPFVVEPLSLAIDDQTAEKFGFPCGGFWERDGEQWNLLRTLMIETDYSFDPDKCPECQGWGYPTGCGTCGLTSMGG